MATAQPAIVVGIETRLSITGLGALSGLGENSAGHLARIDAGDTAFRPLGELLGAGSRYAHLPAAWIESRKLLTHRKWSPASMSALHVAREAVAEAGWTADQLRDAVIFFGTSRGTAASWVDAWPGRRSFPLMAASNSMHSEPAAAVSIELGIHGPWQVMASGCCAGIDALGMAALWLQAGLAERALVISVDLPLSPALLDSYAATGILSSTGVNDPYGPTAAGMLPAEAAAAIALEKEPRSGSPLFTGYLANADAADPIGMPPGAPGIVELLGKARERFGLPALLIPHASGTASHAAAEPPAIAEAFGAGTPVHLLKPWIGHGVGGGGLLETALLAAWLREHRIPAPLPGLTCPSSLSMTPVALSTAAIVFKLASALGGKNSLVALQAP